MRKLLCLICVVTQIKIVGTITKHKIMAELIFLSHIHEEAELAKKNSRRN